MAAVIIEHYLEFSSRTDVTYVTKQLFAWSDIGCGVNHRDTWSQTPIFRPHLKRIPPQKIMANTHKGHRFKIGGSKK